MKPPKPPHPPTDDDKHIEQFAAWSRVNLGMLGAEFYSLLPTEFFVMVKEWEARERRQRVQFAQVCLTVANSMGAKSSTGEPLTIAFFLGEKKPEEPAKHHVSLKQQFINALPAHWRPVKNGHK